MYYILYIILCIQNVCDKFTDSLINLTDILSLKL